MCTWESAGAAGWVFTTGCTGAGAGAAGAGAGVFPGMIFYVKNDPQLKFRVIGTRFEGAVAELADGNWSDVVPGMEVSAFQKVKEPEKLIKR